MKNLISIIALMLLITFHSFGQSKIFTFCYANKSISLYDGGSITLIEYNLDKSIKRKSVGEFTRYGSSNPYMIKILIGSTEFTFDYIIDGNGIPSNLIDRTGSNYTLCNLKTISDQDKVLEDELMLEKWEDENKTIKKNLDTRSPIVYNDFLKMKNQLNNPNFRKDIPQKYDELVNKNYYILSGWGNLTESQINLIKNFKKDVDIIKNENIKKHGSEYGYFIKNSLLPYIYSDEKEILIDTTCVFFSTYRDNTTGRQKTTKKIRVSSGNIYEGEKLIGTISQDADNWIIKCDPLFFSEFKRYSNTNFKPKSHDQSDIDKENVRIQNEYLNLYERKPIEILISKNPSRNNLLSTGMETYYYIKYYSKTYNEPLQIYVSDSSSPECLLLGALALLKLG